MSEFKEVKLTGGALHKPKSRKRVTTTRKNRQDGGDNSGALLQLSAQSAHSPVDPSVQAKAMNAAQQAADALAKFGPDKIQQNGGDNSGALLQLATIPNMGGPMNTQAFANTFRSQVAQVLENNFGPDKSQQFGGKKMRGGDGIAGTIQLSSSRAPVLPGSPEPVPVISGVDPSQPSPVGGSRATTRLVLAPPKRKTRIALKSKKLKGGSESSMQNKNNTPPMPGGTRKARKIHLRVKGVTMRLAKAKKAKRQAMSAPISDVKARLESAGIIKKGSKAPEHMLRNMYADLLITKKGL
jgi:hypothetical protein